MFGKEEEVQSSGRRREGVTCIAGSCGAVQSHGRDISPDLIPARTGSFQELTKNYFEDLPHPLLQRVMEFLDDRDILGRVALMSKYVKCWVSGRGKDPLSKDQSHMDWDAYVKKTPPSLPSIFHLLLRSGVSYERATVIGNNVRGGGDYTALVSEPNDVGTKRLREWLQDLMLVVEVREPGPEKRLIFASSPAPLLGPLMENVFTIGGLMTPFWLEDSLIAKSAQVLEPNDATTLGISIYILDSKRGQVGILFRGTSTLEGDDSSDWANKKWVHKSCMSGYGALLDGREWQSSHI